MENRYQPRSFVNGRIKLSRESAITKSIVSKAEVTMLRGNASCYRVSEKQSFPRHGHVLGSFYLRCLHTNETPKLSSKILRLFRPMDTAEPSNGSICFNNLPVASRRCKIGRCIRFSTFILVFFLFLFLFYRTEFLFMYTGLGDRNLKKITSNKIT